MDPIENPDTQNEDPKYWEKVLHSFGLGMDQGQHSKKISLRGGLKELVRAEEIEYRRSTGRVTPPGAGPDKESDGEGRN